jgi:penicillin amidase
MELPKSGFFPAVFSALLRPIVGRLDRHSLARYSGQLTIPGLTFAVDVRWDDYGIPHVHAANEHDLFIAQGYLHAQERLWQMEVSRRFLAGRMAEIFGDFSLPWKELSTHFRGRTSVDFDYFVRLLGVRDAALHSLAQLPEAEQLRLRDYSLGVNAYIEHCGKRLPWEFRLLRHAPEPWRPEDSLIIVKGFAFLLSTALYTRLNLIAIADKLAAQPAMLRSLMPHYPTDAPTTTRAVWQQASGMWQFTSGVLMASNWHPAGHGSNSWAVAPQRSATGKALLCNDPHLRMTLPSTWYLMHLKADATPGRSDGYEVWGASIAGTPGIQLGHNRWIAWGATAALCDDVEIYRERLHSLEPDRYLVGQEWRKLTSRRETISIRAKKSVEKVIRHTRHGPVISDFNGADNAREILSLRWTAHEPSQELCSVHRINCARNWPEFVDALRDHSAPSLNFVYADRDGNIGYCLAGNIPRRIEEPTLLPLAGSDKSNDWSGYIPFEELPRVYNPPQGAVASANNHITDGAYPYYLSHFFEPPQRLRRIEQRLGARQKLSAEDLTQIQLDDVSLHAREMLETLGEDLARIADQDQTAKQAATRLLSWDGRCEAQSVEAAIFHGFHHRLLVNLLTPHLGEQLSSAYVEILNQCIVPTDRILRDANSLWFTGRSRFEHIARSLREACADLTVACGSDMNKWQWGKIHRLQMNHTFGRIKLLQPLLGIGPLPAPGDGMTVNFGFYRHSNPFAQSAGAALRFLVELEQSPRSSFVLPSGQSGHPLSPHYRDQTQLWQRNAQIALAPDKTETSPSRHLLLKPV